MVKRLLFSFILLTAIVLAPASSALAFKPVTTACQAGGANSAICKDQHNTETISGTTSVLARATNLISILAGAIAVIVIVVSGIFFVTADGDASKAASARNALIGAVVGLAIVVLARAIINFVISRIT